MFSLSTIDGDFIGFYDSDGDALMDAIERGLARGFRIEEL